MLNIFPANFLMLWKKMLSRPLPDYQTNINLFIAAMETSEQFVKSSMT